MLPPCQHKSWSRKWSETYVDFIVEGGVSLTAVQGPQLQGIESIPPQRHLKEKKKQNKGKNPPTVAVNYDELNSAVLQAHIQSNAS